MGRKVNLLDTYPKAKRSLEERMRSKEADPATIAIAKQFGKEFFDGDRKYGYGGYYYDGRWKSVVARMIGYYGLTSQHSILDIGCGKGFLLHDFREALPGVTVAGLEISSYAIEHAMEDVKPFIQEGNAKKLPFADKSFDLVISINTIHNLKEPECRAAVREIQRVSRQWAYIQVDSYRNAQEKENLERWLLTAETYFDPEGWEKLFREEGYSGDYYWTLIE